MKMLNLNGNAPLTPLMMLGMTIATLLGGAVQPVNAQVVVSGPPETLPACNVGAVAFESNATLHQSLACAGAQIGNDLAMSQPLLTWLNAGLFESFTGGGTVWEFAGQSNRPGVAISATANRPQGNWAIADPVQDWFVLSLATNFSYSAYLFDAGPNPITIDQGFFNTLGVSTSFAGVGKDLARISLFTPFQVEIPDPLPEPEPEPNPIPEPEPNPVSVPEPGTILSAVIILGAFRLHQRQSLQSKDKSPAVLPEM